MSMNGFFKAFSDEDIVAMKSDFSLIDKWIFEEGRHPISTDVDSAWDVLAKSLNGAGFYAGELISESNILACTLMSPSDVRDQAEELSRISKDYVLENLRSLRIEEDVYHLKFYQANENMLLKALDNLSRFYREAAQKGLGAISYIE